MFAVSGKGIIMWPLFFYSLVGGVFSLIGGLALLWKPSLTKRLIPILISFGAGAFLAAAFIDVLPEALEMTAEPHPILLAALAGFMLFFMIERYLMRFHSDSSGHDHDEHTESLPFLLILGDCIHNFLDGIVIALAYMANPGIGLSAALAIAAHEVPQEIADFSLLLHLGWRRRDVVVVNLLQSLLTIPGVAVGMLIGHVLEPQLPLLLGGTAGIFLYIAASDLVPTLHHQSGHKHFARAVLPMIASIALIWYLVALTH